MKAILVYDVKPGMDPETITDDLNELVRMSQKFLDPALFENYTSDFPEVKIELTEEEKGLYNE